MSDCHRNGLVTDVLGRPRERPFIPGGHRVEAAIPDLPERR
ncbi:hypothetical protein [Halomonas denitrificans]|nr:hypothetical protein [Halomonas denitrificans]